jgi:hypothetical protein
MTKFHNNWYSQAGQDKWVCEFFNYKKNGYFLDIGAGDGIGDSNTYYLEKKLNWKGICIECGDVDFEKCKSIRSATCVKTAIWSTQNLLFFDIGTHSVNEKGIGILIPSTTLTLIFKKHNVPELIDYVSLDIEGSELEALNGWPWETHKVILWTVEHNLYMKNDPKMKNDLYNFLTEKGYIRVVENVTCVDSHNGPFEDWYVHKDYIK